MNWRHAALATAVTATLTGVAGFAFVEDSDPNRGEGAPVYLVTSMNGANEVTAGDKDGHALEFLEIQGNRLSYSIEWQGMGKPTAAHIHAGAKGVNGAVRVPLFEGGRKAGGPRSATGSVTVNDRKLLDGLRTNPAGYYANLHTALFPMGAVRGQLHKLTRPIDMGQALTSRQIPDMRGSQVYACVKRPDGSYGFSQHDVRAGFRDGVRHSFVRPDVGPPQWVAPDGSSVTGTVLARTPNGEGNIPELDLKAHRSGRAHGLLAHVQEVLRLNTVGGVAPSGPCEPVRTPTIAVPYQADYLFVRGG